jgi:hypothetical protein
MAGILMSKWFRIWIYYYQLVALIPRYLCSQYIHLSKTMIYHFVVE